MNMRGGGRYTRRGSERRKKESVRLAANRYGTVTAPSGLTVMKHKCYSRLCNSCLNYLDKLLSQYKRATNHRTTTLFPPTPANLTPFLPSVIRICVISLPRHNFPPVSPWIDDCLVVTTRFPNSILRGCFVFSKGVDEGYPFLVKLLEEFCWKYTCLFDINILLIN